MKEKRLGGIGKRRVKVGDQRIRKLTENGRC